MAWAGVTPAAALNDVIDQLGQVRGPMQGVVLDEIDFKPDAAYDPAYRFHEYTSHLPPIRD
jgi:hypothetical protein